MEYIKSKLAESSSSTNPQANGHLPNGHAVTPRHQQNGYANGHIPNGHVPTDTELHDLEVEPLQTVSQKVSNGVAHTIADGIQKIANGHGVANGFVANGHAPMYSEHI